MSHDSHTEDEEIKMEQKALQKSIDKWYQDLLDHIVKTSPDHAMKFAAIVSYPKADKLLAVYPEDFQPDVKGVNDIIAALHEGDTSAIAEDGLYLGEGCMHGIPGKLDPGKGIYGTDGGEGGTDAFVAAKSVLLGSYIARPAASSRLLRKTALHMLDHRK